MTENKNAIAEIKDLLKKFGFLKDEDVNEKEENSNEETPNENEETFETFISATLQDGTKISISGENIEVGATVTVLTDDAEVPAPDGEYVLDDGTVILTEGGLITEITTPEAEDGEVPVEQSADDVTELVDLMKTVITKLGEFTESMDNKFKVIEDNVKELDTEIKEFGKLPAGDKIKQPKTDPEQHKLTPLEAKVQAVMGFKTNKNTKK